MIDDYEKAELARVVRRMVERDDAAEKVPVRIRELRMNIDRLEGRDGRPAVTREQNQFELHELVRRAEFEGLPTEVDDQPQAEETE